MKLKYFYIGIWIGWALVLLLWTLKVHACEYDVNINRLSDYFSEVEYSDCYGREILLLSNEEITNSYEVKVRPWMKEILDEREAREKRNNKKVITIPR